LYLRVGDRVRVRALSEILATLDGAGRLDALPFMPEMVPYCGQEFTVLKRVDKINDTVDRTGLRRMDNTVILDGLLCDGGAHDGCEARCQTLWKEAWLLKLHRGAGVSDRGTAARTATAGHGEPELVQLTLRRLAPGEVRYVCQATELKRASAYLAWWDPRQYVKDLRSGNVGFLKMIRVFLFWIFSRFIVREMPGGTRLVPGYNFIQQMWGGEPIHIRQGALKTTPSERLDLQPGELVQVKSYDEIVDTLDAQSKNRGLRFDVEQMKYCGGTYRVLARVNRIIDHHTGEMLELPTVSIILEGVTVVGDHHRFYPQNEFSFWREIWLRRVAAPSVPTALHRENAHA
jgi:hypothetical protein